MKVRTTISHITYYGNRPMRARRRLSRYVAALRNPRNYPTGRAINGYWFDQFENFGDALTPWLLQEAGYMPRLSKATDAELAGVGSIIELLPQTFSGAVWGSGLLYGQPRTLPEASWLAVRGAGTRSRVNAPSGTPLGDPGLLVSRFVKRPRTHFSLGLVPHHAHKQHTMWRALQRTARDCVIIDPIGPPKRIVSQIAGCSTIITSSLHGLITADAYQVPAAWITLPGHALRGGDFKFHDYESAFSGLPARGFQATPDAKLVLEEAFDLATSPSVENVSTIQENLLNALSAAPHRPLAPWRSF